MTFGGGLLPPGDEDSETSSSLEAQPSIVDVEAWYEDGFSMAPDGCRVDLPEERCSHGMLTWALILSGTEDTDPPINDD